MTTVEDTNVSVSEDSEPQAQTVMDFFRNLRAGTFVSADGDTQYIYYGMDRLSDENRTRVPLLIHSIYMEEVKLTFGLDEENRWATVNVDGEVKFWDDQLQQALYQMRQNSNRATRWEQRFNEQHEATRERDDQIRLMRADFEHINERLGYYAVEQQYCSTYERIIEEWNEKLTTFKLLGRVRAIWVPVVMTIGDQTQTVSVKVESRSDELARQAVSQMSNHDIFRNLVDQGSYFDGFNFMIEGSNSEDDDDEDDD